jgi:mitosis inhibitor protein kinase SWE1
MGADADEESLIQLIASALFRRSDASPGSSPRVMCLSDGGETQGSDDDDDDMFFDGPKDSSFVFSVTEGTPSPTKQSGPGVLQKKYKPRDSGVVVTDDEGTSMTGSFLSLGVRAHQG